MIGTKRIKKFIALAAALMLIGQTAAAEGVSAIGSARETVHELMGAGETSSAGLKECYDLGGTEAILHFDNDILVRGFLVNK